MFIVFNYIENKDIVYVKLFCQGTSTVIAELTQNSIHKFMEYRNIERSNCLKCYFGLTESEIDNLFIYGKIEKKLLMIEYYISELNNSLRLEISFRATSYSQNIVFAKIVYDQNSKLFRLLYLEDNQNNYCSTEKLEHIKKTIKQIFNFNFDEHQFDLFEAQLITNLFLKNNK